METLPENPYASPQVDETAISPLGDVQVPLSRYAARRGFKFAGISAAIVGGIVATIFLVTNADSLTLLLLVPFVMAAWGLVGGVLGLCCGLAVGRIAAALQDSPRRNTLLFLSSITIPPFIFEASRLLSATVAWFGNLPISFDFTDFLLIASGLTLGVYLFWGLQAHWDSA